MANRVTLYPIYSIARGWDDEPFDLALLPFSLFPDLAIEDVSPMFNERTFDWLRNEVGRYAMQDLQGVHYTLVHRYQTSDLGDKGRKDEESEELVRNVAACLRIIRPMRQGATLMRGELERDGAIDIDHFEHPVQLMEVPYVQKLFDLRTRDAQALKDLLGKFLQAMRCDFWKFRMAVQFHEAGHWQDVFWKARYSLWCSALEALYTSNGFEHRGSLVAKERIKWLIGSECPVYDHGDIPRIAPSCDLTVAQVVDDIYAVRNYVAHGEKVPDAYFQREGRLGIGSERIGLLEVLHEALSAIIRKSLLKILRDDLLTYFQSADSAETYFAAAGLTRTEIKRTLRAPVPDEE